MGNMKTADYKNGIFCVDSGYEGGGVAAVYVIRDGRGAAIVDTVHNDALEPVTAAMSKMGIPPGEVEYIFLTHVHLDHAGGAGRFAAAFPDAKVVVHSRGARHMTDPSKLVAGATEVYGREEMARLYGTVLPVSPDRLIIPEDGQEFHVGGRVITCLDTPGHAKHHLAYHDPSSRAVFSGDAYGMSYMELAGEDGRCAIITTSPVQFDPDAMRASMRRIESLSPEYIYPTHYGRMPIGGAASESLHRQLGLSVQIAESCGGDIDLIRDELRKMFASESAAQGFPEMGEKPGRLTEAAIEINSQGLAVWFAKKRR